MAQVRVLLSPWAAPALLLSLLQPPAGLGWQREQAPCAGVGAVRGARSIAYSIARSITYSMAHSMAQLPQA